MREHAIGPGRGESGNALLVSLVLTFSLLGVTLTSFVMVQGSAREQTSAHEHMKRLYYAELGVERALYQLSSGGDGNVGSEVAPLTTDGGSYWTETTDLGNDTFEVTAHGLVRDAVRTIQAVVLIEGYVFHHSVFAGNSSGDPTYELKFGGTGSQADEIVGDVYSGNDVRRTAEADIAGTIRAAGTVHGAPGENGVSQPLPDLAAMSYETNHDVDVAAEFAAATYQSDDAGGTAWQLPATNPAHVFRKNPSDRATANAATVKDDYFLEDPYETVTSDDDEDGTSPYRVSLNETGLSISATHPFRRVYYIDGNLWVHNTKTFSFRLASLGLGTQVTFVVRGNLYISDNLFLDDTDHDGVAFIALKDPAVPDSGNIYFGDALFGTLKHMDAYMFAENDFRDQNLDASGSNVVTLNGTMSAGNQVSIERDYANHHSKLEVVMDSRLRDGLIELPGLPGLDHKLEYSIVSWREISSEP